MPKTKEIKRENNPNRNPTIRQREAINKIVESHGKISVSKAMRDSGYSDKTAKNPKNLTESNAWDNLVEKFLPDKDLVKVHKEGLKATTRRPHLIDRDDKGRPIYDYVKEDDFPTRHKYLDTAYKLKKRLNSDVPLPKSTYNQFNIFLAGDDKVKETIQKSQEELRKVLEEKIKKDEQPTGNAT